MKTFLSPAKINVFLRVHHRRADGYHEIASLFQAVSLFDVLHIALSEFDSLTTTDPCLETDETNLVNKAKAIFKGRLNKPFSVKIHVEKNIPKEAGLGGGSSNAATTLWALNTLLENPFSLDELKEMGALIGSDVPFFLSEGTAFCTGRGESMRSSFPIVDLKFLTIVKPPFGISTKDVYRSFDAERVILRDSEETLHKCLKGDFVLYNDLEVAAFECNPSMKVIRDKLVASGFDDVLMCGSGSSFFCRGIGDLSEFDKDFQVYNVVPVSRPIGLWYSKS